MKTVWMKGLNAQQKVETKQEYIKSAPLRGRLSDMLKEKIDFNRASVRSNNSYDSPNWSLLQADSIGYERALFEVISLLFDEKVQKEQKIQ